MHPGPTRGSHARAAAPRGKARGSTHRRRLRCLDR